MHKTLGSEFLATCVRNADKELMRIKSSLGWEAYRYGQVRDCALAVAHWLIKNKFKKHDRAVVVLENHPQWAMAYFGIILAGGTCVPLDPQARERDIATFIEDAGSRVVFIESKLAGSLGKTLSSVSQVIVVGVKSTTDGYTALEELIACGPAPEPLLPAQSPDDIASILYSSGTTSQPKGVQLSHKNFCTNFNSINQIGICTFDDIFISVLPLFHAYAFMGTLLLPLFIGAKIVYPATLKSAELLSVIRETQVSILVGVPELFAAVARSITAEIQKLPAPARALVSVLTFLGWQLKKYTRFNCLRFLYHRLHARFGPQFRYFVSGGARLEPAVALRLQCCGFDIIEGYGLTETAPIATLNPPARPKVGSVGKVVPGVDVTIVNPDADGVGEVAIRGDNVMMGYYKKPQETAQVIRDGWFYSGDLGRFDRDGYLFLVGRIKEVIVLSSGKNIFPDEIEKSYLASPYIKEAGVFLSSGESQTLKAVIVPDLDAFKKTGEATTIHTKLRWEIENVSEALSPYKRIRGFAVSQDELPRTRLGKLKRYQLEGMYARLVANEPPSEESDEDAEKNIVLQTPQGRAVADFLARELGLRRQIRATDHLELDLGIDSLARVELVAAFERMFHIKLADDAFIDVHTVADVVNKLCALTDMGAAGKTGPDSAAPVLLWQELLNVDITPQHFKDINLQPGGFDRVLSYAARAFFLCLLKLFFRLRVIGRDAVPRRGPFIICCNHASYFDAFVMLTGLPYSVALQTYFVGFRDIFYQPTIRWAIRLARLIPIDPSVELIRAMRASSYVLKNNKIICIFPEGQRSIDGAVHEFKKGVGILTRELNVDILPVAIAGAYEAWPRTRVFPRLRRITIAFGTPVRTRDIVEGASSASASDTYKMIAERIRDAVTRLHAVVNRQ